MVHLSVLVPGSSGAGRHQRSRKLHNLNDINVLISNISKILPARAIFAFSANLAKFKMMKYCCLFD